MGFRDEMAVRAAKRSAIQGKIRELSGKIDEAREIIDELNDCKREMTRDVEEWSHTYQSFQAVPIQSEVVVEDMFEGVIAEVLSSEIPECAEKMNKTCGMMKDLCGEIAKQVGSLQEYIIKLQQEKESLYAELSTI